MNKKVLIISPYFPPVNAADMQRVRMSLPYFAALGWDAEIVTVDGKYSDIVKDDLLSESIPANIKIHKVKALNKGWTAKFGLGSIALRSLWFYRQKVNEVLNNEKFDLIYFSTTQFAVCALGAGWKKRFGVPYVIDMQDPWYTGHYFDTQAEQRPPKYRIAYLLHKFMEAIAMKQVNGLISVSADYITHLENRYPRIKNLPSAIITFGAFEQDSKTAAAHKDNFKPILDTGTKNIVYIGRGGTDLYKAIVPAFEALAKGLADEPEIFKPLKFYFIGTSYAAAGKQTESIMPLAKQYGLEKNIIEISQRISYYHTLITLQQADALFIPGSDQPAYTASKIYPYILSNKPILSIFNSQSSAINVLDEFNAPYNYSYDATTEVSAKVYLFLKQVAEDRLPPPGYNLQAIKKYSAQNMALQQCAFFDRVIKT